MQASFVIRMTIVDDNRLVCQSSRDDIAAKSRAALARRDGPARLGIIFRI